MHILKKIKLQLLHAQMIYMKKYSFVLDLIFKKINIQVSFNTFISSQT